MARPRKDDRLKSKRREISATDTDWKAVRAEAKAAGLSMSRYLIERRATAPAKVPPETIARYLETTLEIRDWMSRIARTLTDIEATCTPGILLELVAIERRLAALTEAAARK